MTPILYAWGCYHRWTARWPSLAALVPFVPVIALWWIVAAAGVFPKAFFPGPVEVASGPTVEGVDEQGRDAGVVQADHAVLDADHETSPAGRPVSGRHAAATSASWSESAS